MDDDVEDSFKLNTCDEEKNEIVNDDVAIDSCDDIRYKVDDVPPWYLCIVLAFQHYLTMFGSTATIALVLCPAMCIPGDSVANSNILSSLFVVSGLITLLQSSIGIRLPIVQGGTFSFLVPTFAILSLPRWTCPVLPPDGGNQTGNLGNGSVGQLSEEEIWQPRMREIQGAIITASVFQVMVGATGLMGLILRYLGPLTITPTICLIGLALFDVAASMCATQWGIAMFTVVLITLFSQYLRNVEVPVCSVGKKGSKGWKCHATRYPLFKTFPVILAILVSWLFCYILTASGAIKDDPDAMGYKARTDLKSDVLYKSPWFRVPYPFQWGLPTFTLAGTLGMLAGVAAGMMESLGDYYACARLSGSPPPPVHAVNRGMLIEGIGCVISGMFGTGSGTTSYSENVGAIGITKVGSRRVIQTAGVVMIVLGTFSKFGALFVTIPSPVVGGLFMVMFGMITAVGTSNLQYVNMNSSRNMFIFGFSVILGLGVSKWVSQNKEQIDTGIDVADQLLIVMLSTGMFLGGATAFILDNTIPGTPEERGMVKWRRHLTDVTGSKLEGASVHACYDIPYITRWLRRQRWTYYIPFCPTFRGYTQSRCCKK